MPCTKERQRVLNKCYAPNSKVCLITRIYGVNPEEVGHGHVADYANMELYGFSMELSAQK